jgi:DNA-binding NtrC family response regulator
LSSGSLIPAVKLKKLQQKERAEMRSRILFVSGHPDDARRLSRMLHSLLITVDHVETLQQAHAKLQQNDYGVILTEANLPDGTWPDALDLARQCNQELEVIVTDPQADARFWAEALNLGAYDLLAQPFYEPEVRRILYNACSRLGTRAMAAV